MKAKKRVGIIGGGITGLALAYDLLKDGHEVVIYESSDVLGGLANAIEVEGNYIERFYHHLFKSDEHLIELLGELDLSDKLQWLESQIGFYGDGQVFKLGKPTDLLFFKPLSWIGKIKFGLSVVYFQRKANWEGLDRVPIRDWFARFRALEVYEKIWEPLLKLKFGDEFRNVAAAWLWGRINPRARSREKAYENERLGYISGSFHLLFEKLSEKIIVLGSDVRTGESVKLIEPLEEGRLKIHANDIQEFDKVVVTLHIPTFLKLAPDLPSDYCTRLQRIRYQEVICMLFVLDSPLSDEIYWLNVNDSELPFGGIIEHTNFMPKSEYRDKSLVYVFNYVASNDPMTKLSETEIRDLYIEGIKKVYPGFEMSSIVDIHLSRASFATPIYTLDYPDLMPSFETPIPNLFLANTAQVYPEDRNVNNCARNAQALAEIIKAGC